MRGLVQEALLTSIAKTSVDRPVEEPVFRNGSSETM